MPYAVVEGALFFMQHSTARPWIFVHLFFQANFSRGLVGLVGKSEDKPPLLV